MNEIVLTIRIQLPDGARVQVATEPDEALPTGEPPHPAETMDSEPTWPPGKCPIHNEPWKHGQYGPFCSKQAAQGGPANPKGYCAAKPGLVWQGRRMV